MPEPSAATPLIGDSPPPARPAPSSSAGALRAHHWLCLILLLLYLMATFLSSLSAFWTLFSFAILLLFFIHAARSFLRSYKPPSLPKPFLLTQAALGALVVPIPVIVLTVLVTLALLIPAALSVFLVVFVFALLHPDAMQAISQPPAIPSPPAGTQFHQTLHIAAHSLTPRLSSLALRGVDLSRVATHVAEARRAMGGAHEGHMGGKVWHDLVEAGVPPGDLIIVVMMVALIAVSFMLCVAVGVHAVVEYVRWRLFTRYVKAGDAANDDRDTAAGLLGVDGLVTVAMVGAFGMAMGGVANAVVAASPEWRSLYQPTIYGAVVLVVGSLLNVVVFVGSQLYVATAHAERMLLGSTKAMREVWVTSVVYNFGMMFLSVAPPSPSVPKGPPVVLFIVVTGLKAGIVFMFTRKAVNRFSQAREAEAEAA